MADKFQPTDAAAGCSRSVEDILRDAAFQAWTARREDWQDSSSRQFDRCYLGHYSHIDDYVESLVDSYGLDDKLDAAIAPPFREHVDLDVSALAQSLVRHGSLYAIPAAPVGVWVFNGDIE
ncbi:MAG TPA: hypothetical protein VHO01_07965 [Jatrophihabitans sp.]|nr:hypothetical protein [Jatrophihabitans sp.]